MVGGGVCVWVVVVVVVAAAMVVTVVVGGQGSARPAGRKAGAQQQARRGGSPCLESGRGCSGRLATAGGSCKAAARRCRDWLRAWLTLVQLQHLAGHVEGHGVGVDEAHKEAQPPARGGKVLRESCQAAKKRSFFSSTICKAWKDNLKNTIWSGEIVSGATRRSQHRCRPLQKCAQGTLPLAPEGAASTGGGHGEGVCTAGGQGGRPHLGSRSSKESEMNTRRTYSLTEGFLP